MRLIDADALIGSLHNYGFYDGNDREMVYRVIQLQPTIEPEQKWIPCSERYPREEGLYIVSGDGKAWICQFTCIGNMRGWINNIKNPCVKAWMPLPEPYKGEQE